MVRNYKRKSDKMQYTASDLQEALAEIRSGESVRGTSKRFKISAKTLRRHRDNKVKSPGTPRLGRYNNALSNELELAIVVCIKDMERRMFGLNTKDIRKLAFDVAEQSNSPHPFNRETRMAGLDWMNSFMKRHHLSVRIPQATSLARVVGFNKPKVDQFFLIYAEILQKHDFSANNIWNMDETGVTTVQNPTKVVTTRGKKQVGKITSGERGELVTVICCMNASGNFLPPMFIFPRKNMRETLMNGAPPQSIGDVSDSGWTDGDLFIKWLRHFVKLTNSTKNSPNLIVLDGHHSHKTLDAVNFCRENGIELLTLPPHSSHKMQPLDCSYFKSLKSAYNSSADNWMLSNPGKRMSIYDVAGICGKAFLRTAVAEKAVNGFHVTGIWPYNKDIFMNEQFIATDLTDAPDPYEPSTSSERRPLPEENSTSSERRPLPEEPSTSSGRQPLALRNLQNLQSNSENSNADESINTQDISNETSETIVRQIMVVPKCVNERKRTRRCESASHLTSTPSKQILEEKKQEKDNKAERMKKKKATRQLKIVYSNDSSEDEEWPCLVCGEPFANSRSREKWIQCVSCLKWAHEECTSGDRGYVCQNCDSE